jgi:hypothetical protein
VGVILGGVNELAVEERERARGARMRGCERNARCGLRERGGAGYNLVIVYL